jgi:hypothetical protein
METMRTGLIDWSLASCIMPGAQESDDASVLTECADRIRRTHATGTGDALVPCGGATS